MLITAMRRENSIDMRVMNTHSPESSKDQQLDLYRTFNGNSNNNNNNSITTTTMRSSGTTVRSDENLSDISGSLSTVGGLHRNTVTSSYPNPHGHSKHLQNISDRSLNGKTFGLTTGLTERTLSFSMVTEHLIDL